MKIKTPSMLTIKYDQRVNILSHGLTQRCSLLPRSMECRRGLAMRILSVRSSVSLSVCLSVKRVIATKRKKDLSDFYTTRKII